MGQRNNGAKRGLNENYARELLELHTLGVNGGYTQADVQELARILTGWTIEGIGGPGARVPQGAQPRRASGVIRRARPEPGSAIGFTFREMLHEPGTKTVLNERYKEDGLAEGEHAIRALCRHPSTAQFVATKLATHFISDDPPAAAVDRLARAFRSSEGDLKVVARTLIDEPEAWREDARKFRTPQDWFVAVMRAFGANEVNPNAPGRAATTPAAAVVAAIAEGLRRRDAGVGGPGLAAQSRRAGAHDLPAARAWPHSTLARCSMSSMCRPGNPLHSLIADTSIPAPERVALAIAGPAFQWR